MELAYLQHRAPAPSLDSIFSLLQICSKGGTDLPTCRNLFGIIILHGLDSASILGDYLIRLFTACRSLLDADQVYIKSTCPTVYTWNAIISAHAKLGDELTAIALFHRMQGAEVNIRPDRVTFLTLLKASHSIRNRREGMLIHDYVNRSEYAFDGVVGNTLVDMYAKCGCLDEACCTFDNLACKDLVSWSAMMGGYAELGYGLSALELFEKMLRRGMEPCNITYLHALKACSSIQTLHCGRQVHEGIVKSGLDSDITVACSLVDLYCKCCSLEEARRVFDLLPKRNVVSWGTMIAGYVQHLNGESALELFTQMQQESIDPDALIYSDILKACGSIKALEQGRLVHKKIEKSAFASDVIVRAALVDFYGKCGSLEEAQLVFEQSGKQEEMMWAALLAGYAEHGPARSALELYDSMLQEGICPSKLGFLSVLKACGSYETVGPSRLIHDQIIRAGLDTDVVFGTVIIDMYVKLARLKEAHSVLNALPNPDSVSWTAVMLGYAEHGDAALAVELLKEMQQAGITPDRVTFLCMIKACSNTGALAQGRLIHENVIRFDFLSDLLIGSTLVDMYIKCGSLEDGQKVLDDLPTRTVVAWSALISGYVEDGHGYVALQLFEKMQHEHIKPNEVTLLYLLKACASIGVVEAGRWLHDEIMREGMMQDMILGSVLVEMYALCGSLEEARCVFLKLRCRDTVSWGAIISGYAQHGNLRLAAKCLNDMQEQGLKPNAVIFASMLSACSNAGLIQEGWHYLNNMFSHYGVEPGVEHYSCMVDLLGRAGYLKDAARLLESMPVLPNIVGWTSLLTNCKRHGTLELGARCFNKAVDLDSNDASSYLLLSSMFGDCRLWERVSDVQDWRKQSGAEKPGQDWIDAHELIMDDV